jgi:hypothetical protein
MAALDAGVPLRDVQIAARRADPRTTTVDDRRHQNIERYTAYRSDDGGLGQSLGSKAVSTDGSPPATAVGVFDRKADR